MMMQQVLISLIKAYRIVLSPWLGSACRFTPTCSAYALQALTEQGAAKGSYLTLKRLGRCHPWCHGGHDPVPTVKPTFFAPPLGPSPSSSSSTGSTLP